MKYLKIASCIAIGLSAQCRSAESLENSPTSVTISQPLPPSPDIHGPIQKRTNVATQKRINAASVKKTHVHQKELQAHHNPSDPLAPNGDVVRGAPPPPRAIGPLSYFGNYLIDHGIHVDIFADDFYLREIRTGLVPNKSMNAGDIKYHLGLDLDQILGIPNTHLNFDETQYTAKYHAFNFVNYSNSFFFPGAGGDKPTMLSRLSLETSFLNDHLHVEVGRMNPIFNFMTPLFCGACFNGTQARNADFPGPDAQAWGGRAAYKLSPNDTVQVGLYENDLYVFQNTDGWYFSTKHATGYIALANYMHETTFLDDTHPLKLEVGMFHNSAPYTDPVLNTDGSSQVSNPFGTALVHSEGTTGAYTQFRKVIWSEDGALGNPFAQNVAIYGSLFATPGDGVSYPLEAITGVEWSNFVPGQPFWMFGIGLHYAMVGNEKALYEQQMRTFLGGPNVPTPQHMFDPTVVLRFPISQFAIAQPYAFYFINQDQSYIPSAQRQKDGWFVGFRVTVNVGGALGLSAGGPPL